jgi:two-component system, NarL family, sensor histidine kinase BarA
MDNISTLKTESIIDWELATKLAGNKPDLAKNLLEVLVKTLPIELHDIKQAKDNPLILRMQVHKLHGAVSYCGVPRLKKTLAAFESALKRNELQQVDEFLTTLEQEVTLVLEEFAGS